MGKSGGWYLLNETIVLFLTTVLLSGCAAEEQKVSVKATCSDRVSPVYASAERSYCSSIKPYTNSATITGTASYEALTYTANNGLGSMSSPQPIRHAEIVVYAENGSIIQCGETDGNGAFSLQLPQTNKSHTLRIYSRGNNTNVKASVLNCPEENVPYSLYKSFIPNTHKDIGNLLAKGDPANEMLGAAFNIFDQIVKANDFLRTQVGNCTHAGCADFTVAPKVQAYWSFGFNPNVYFSSTDPLSFYLPGYRRLFILGGEDGDVFTSDTDHFDNSVILHEYGHFLEDVYTKTDSPGGAHNGAGIIDPRLAWGEGWGNFIQAAIRNEPRYRDTIGTPSAANPISTSSYIFNIPIETTSPSCNTSPGTSGCDIPIQNYEGNFREFSVTRMLWDIFDDANGADSDFVANQFQEIWTALTWTSGFLNNALGFRNAGLLHEIQQEKITGSSDWSSVVTHHKHGDTAEYAQYVTPTNSCASYALDPLSSSSDNGTFATSHLVRNNDFFYYRHTGGNLTLTLNANSVNANSYEPDLDLYLYNSDGRFGNSSDIIKSSDNYWDNNAATQQTETITVKNLPSGKYLINIKIFTGRYLIDNNSSTNNCAGSAPYRICENDADNFIPAGDDITYDILANGVKLCPTALP